MSTTTNTLKPAEIWGGNVNKEGEGGSQFGCLHCLLENMTAPVDTIYMWGGTSLCRKHVLAQANNAQ